MKRLNTLYFFECIASILVVLIHVPFSGDIGLFFSETGRISVPLFFMISGYSLYDSLGTPMYKTKLRTRLKRNSKQLVWFVLFYLTMDIVKRIILHKSVWEYFRSMFLMKYIVKLICVTNFPPVFGGTILWFLFAMLYIYIFNILLSNKIAKKNLNCLFIISILTLAAANSFFFIFTIRNNVLLSSHWIYSNWLVSGLPCFFIGMFCKCIVNNHLNVIRKMRFLFIGSGILLVIINFIFCKWIHDVYQTYFSYTLFTIAIDIIIILISNVIQIRDGNVISIAGERYSRYVYILHPFVFSCISIIARRVFNVDPYSGGIIPVILILLSFAVAVIYERCMMVWNNLKSHIIDYHGGIH